MKFRSPSPLHSPAHLHLAMDPGLATPPPHNNNTPDKPEQRPIPSTCSTQLAKVLEKQIEVMHLNGTWCQQDSLFLM